MSNFPKTLILIITYRCNMRCVYCSVEQADKDMSVETALLALGHFLECSAPPRRVRFFGGEPLLNFGLVRKAALEAERAGAGLSMNLTTNGTLLDDETIGFFEERSDFDLIVSLDGPRETHCSERRGDGDIFGWTELYAKRLSLMKNVIVNKVVSPGNVSRLLDDFAFIRKLGFSRINVLPAYYVHWPREALIALNERLEKLARLIRMMERDGFPVSIRNLELSGELPLFNTGMVVDTDGGVYAANHIMYGELRRLREDALRTDVRAFNPESLAGAAHREMDFIARGVPRETLECAYALDAALSKFVNALDGFGPAGHSGGAGDSSPHPMS